MAGLPVLLRIAGAPVILVGAGEMADAKRRTLERAGARVVDEDSPEAAAAHFAWVAFFGAESDAAAARLKARGLLINVADRPELCDFTMPAIVDREPVLIAISTAGASAGLAAALRQRIEALLPPRLGALARALHGARARLRERFPDFDERRRAIAAGLAPGGPIDPLDPDAPDQVGDWLGSETAVARSGLVTIRLTSPDPDDLSLRQARALAMADRVWHARNVPSAILERARGDAGRIACDVPPGDPGTGYSVYVEMAG